MIGSSAVTRPLAGRRTSIDVAPADVDVRLAVRHHDDLLPAQLVVQDRAQRFGRPGKPFLVARSVLGFDVANQARAGRAAIGRNLRRRRARPTGATIPSPRSSARRPCTQPRQLSWAMTTVMSDDRHAEADEEKEKILSRLLAPARDEAHVVHEHQPPDRDSLGFERPDRHEQWPLGAAQQVTRRTRELVERSAIDLGRERGVETAWPRRAGQNPIAKRRSSCVIRVKNCTARLRLPVRSRSCRGSCTVVAIRLARMSRSRTDHRIVNLSTRGTAAYAKAASARSSGMTNRRERRMICCGRPSAGRARIGPLGPFLGACVQ